jgi:hypothetical protein
MLEHKIETLIEEAVGDKVKLAATGTGAAALAAKKLGLLKGGALAKGMAGVGKGLGALKGGSGAVMIDPSLSRADAAKNSAIASGVGTALINSPAAIFGGLPGAALAIGSGMAAAKGGALGAVLGGGRDTLAKSSLIPAGVVAAAAPLTDMAMQAAGYDVHVNPGWSAAITGGLGAGTWAMRNAGNKNKQYI